MDSSGLPQVNSLIKDPSPDAPVPPILPPKDGYLFLDKTKFAASFADDVEPEKAAFMADSQVPCGGVMGPTKGSIEEPLTVLAELKRQGLIRHLGLSNVSPEQLTEGQSITEIVCVQNLYNVAHRKDDGLIDELSGQGKAYVPFFPLGGFTPLQSSKLDAAATSLQATPVQVALAWPLQRSPNILLIPGTSSLEHLRENLKAASLQLPPEINSNLDSIG
jgi:pyridoxine 4-dehydrogenase